MTTHIPLSQRRRIDKAIDLSRRLSIEATSVSAMIRALRQRLGMSQTQLARRSKISQPHLARIEGGRLDPQISTLESVFQALFCEMIVLGKPTTPFDEILKAQAEKVARQRVQHVLGTMALEKQQPDAEAAEAMIREERDRLLRKPSSELWDE